MVSQCTKLTNKTRKAHSKVLFKIRSAVSFIIKKHSIYLNRFHKMPQLLPQFKKLNRDTNGQSNGKWNLPLHKELGASSELIFQKITREVFSLTVTKTTQIPEPWLKSNQIQSNTSIIKLLRINRWKEDTSVSLYISIILMFSSNRLIITISC